MANKCGGSAELISMEMNGVGVFFTGEFGQGFAVIRVDKSNFDP
jgi:hypothetical protein